MVGCTGDCHQGRGKCQYPDSCRQREWGSLMLIVALFDVVAVLLMVVLGYFIAKLI